jgi:putative spermidine/putrescine transport system permease protein
MTLFSRLLRGLFMTSAGIVLALPIIVVCAAALNDGRSMLFPPQNPTLARFGEFFLTDSVWTNALTNSIVIASFSALLSIAIAWPVAYWAWKKNNYWSKLLASITTLPFALPPIVFGVGLGFMWAFSGLLGSMTAGVISHATLLAALPLTTISIGLQSIDRSQLDATATMGATDWQTFSTIIFPLTLPYTISGFFFTLILSFNEFIVMFFVSASSYSTVTLQIFNSLRNGFTPTMAVGAISFIVAALLVFGLIGRFGNLPKLMGAD